MQTIDIPIQQGQWLSKTLKLQGYVNIPTNVILNKTVTGIGATTLEIEAKRHSIIIEPNVPVILGKTKNKPELFAVWEYSTKAKIKKYFKDRTVQYKKLLTTPEGFKKITDVCKRKDVNIDIYNYFFCLFDECEKIVQDIDFRDKIIQPINDFFLFKNKAFVSATPVKMTHPEFNNQGFKILKVKPQYNYKKDLNLIITDCYEIEVIKKFNELKDSNCVCIFLNKTDSIEKLINTLKIANESKIFCSDKSVKKLKNIGYNNVFDQIDLPLKKYNFFTCRFFSAVDIEIRQKPDILLLTNLNDAYHTMIDPFTEAIQISGRFRNKYHNGQLPFNSLTHITNLNPDMQVKYSKDVNTMVRTWEQTYKYINNRLQNETDIVAKQTLKKELQKVGYADLLDEKGNFNYFSLDNLHNEERVKRYYNDFNNWLVRAYRYTGHFIVNLSIVNHNIACDFKSANLTPAQKREHIVFNLEELSKLKANNPALDIEPYKNNWRGKVITNRENGDLIVDAYYYLGKAEIERIGYKKYRLLKEETDKKKAEKKEKDSFAVIQSEIKQQYQINQTATKNDIKDFLKEVYRLNSIDVSITHNTITKYCDVTSNNSKNPATYTIKGYL